MTRYLYTSVTRISDLQQKAFEIEALNREHWQTGDFILGEVLDTSGLHNIELPNGRMMEAMEGDLVIGALGARAATLEAVGDWQAIDNGTFEALTPAGLMGRVTSRSPFLTPLMPLVYLGHLQRGGEKLTMSGVVKLYPERELRAPIVMITGTSMSSGKTMSGRLIVRLLKQQGLKVIGAKFTGAARYRDVLSYADAGADAIFDFVDMGLPSTVCDPDEFGAALENLLNRIAALSPDVVVAEAGASPLEPYNGKTALDLLNHKVCFRLLCASDPYSVVGVSSAFNHKPDLVAGGAANTSAGIELVGKLSGLPALNLLDRASQERLLPLLMQSLNREA